MSLRGPKGAVAISCDNASEADTAGASPPPYINPIPGEGNVFPGDRLCVILLDLVDTFLHGGHLFGVAVGKIPPLADVIA